MRYINVVPVLCGGLIKGEKKERNEASAQQNIKELKMRYGGATYAPLTYQKCFRWGSKSKQAKSSLSAALNDFNTIITLVSSSVIIIIIT